jgi:hypothetical protein
MRVTLSANSLNQALEAWYEKIDLFFHNLRFKCYESYYSIYVLHVNGETLIVVLHVDDLGITRSNVNLIMGLKKQLENTIEMNNLSLLHLFLGIQVLQMDYGIFISQPKYVLNILQNFGMENGNSGATLY